MSTCTTPDLDIQELVQPLLHELETKGIVALPNLVSAPQLKRMQEAFDAVLQRMRWNNVNGYEKTERFRHMVNDVLLLDQGFLDLPLHPLVTGILDEYLGEKYELTEAKGWQSQPTKKDFHGWHGDMWYDKNLVRDHIPREVKLVFYLTDVKSGAFNYLPGTHRKMPPRPMGNHEITEEQLASCIELFASAGTACLFDTSGIHRQGVPMLEPRRAIFYAFHDPDVPLQPEDIAYYRYHPLLLNAAFLGDLSEQDKRILGFGNKTNYVHAFRRAPGHTYFQNAMNSAFTTKITVGSFINRIVGKAKRSLGMK
jgi:hypothetical protein